MKIHLKSGDTLTLRWSPGNCTGYRAEKIEIDATDVDAMASYARTDPRGFQTAMAQLVHRFPDRRLGDTNA